VIVPLSANDVEQRVPNDTRSLDYQGF